MVAVRYYSIGRAEKSKGKRLIEDYNLIWTKIWWAWLSLLFTLLKSEKSIYILRHYFVSIIKYLLPMPPQQYINIHTYELSYGTCIHCFNHDDNRVGKTLF